MPRTPMSPNQKMATFGFVAGLLSVLVVVFALA